MKKKNLYIALTVVATMAFSPYRTIAATDRDLTTGDLTPNGVVYAGLSPDTNERFYTTEADSPGVHTWSEGDNYCRESQSSGYHDWRLPTQRELNALYESRNKGKLKGTFNETGSDSAAWYWSSSPGGTYDAWAQRFSDGLQGNNFTDDQSSLRCVR